MSCVSSKSGEASDWHTNKIRTSTPNGAPPTLQRPALVTTNQGTFFVERQCTGEISMGSCHSYRGNGTDGAQPQEELAEPKVARTSSSEPPVDPNRTALDACIRIDCSNPRPCEATILAPLVPARGRVRLLGIECRCWVAGIVSTRCVNGQRSAAIHRDDIDHSAGESESVCARVQHALSSWSSVYPQLLALTSPSSLALLLACTAPSVDEGHRITLRNWISRLHVLRFPQFCPNLLLPIMDGPPCDAHTRISQQCHRNRHSFSRCRRWRLRGAM
jgi:hypothetical protein